MTDLNKGFREMGYGLNDDLLWNVERELNNKIPGGDTSKLYSDSYLNKK